jgi:dTMP kinase
MSDLAKRLAGRFLVIDGPDGAGKSTQVRLLADWLRAEGVSVEVARDPGGTPIGERIRAILLDRLHAEMAVPCELMLYMASRAQLAAEVLRPALARGACVLCDRYISSTVAYQGAGGADTEHIRQVGLIAVGGLWPDLTILLDLPAQKGLARLAPGRDRVESKDFAYHSSVREIFLQQARQDRGGWAVVDAADAVEVVQSRLRAILQEWKFRGVDSPRKRAIARSATKTGARCKQKSLSGRG